MTESPNMFAVCASDNEHSENRNQAATRSSLIGGLRDWGDQDTWQEFFDTYWKLIYSVATKAGLTESEARDVVQETVVAVAKQVREDRYDRKRGSFRNWLCLITRRRIIDHLRERTDPKLRHVPDARTQTRTETIARVPDPASPASEAIWEDEWRKNFLDVAIERVRQQINPRQFQIFDLSVMRELPVSKVTQLLKVNAAQVYLARHRVGALVKKEVQRLEARAENPSSFEK